ncbi:thiopurine S-methyltransferase [Zhongshania aliphaticivorans]|uniref:thiopurine S-methyltransferase n=1 Tax=Zhongshania aliphaticivorans TaxID=1470434 RepID=UPI0012E6DCE8|nr:thiopurine S-methyltransferase [Zhongshania aliphaticivorans]CAA0101549.1 Thiopurine S-methyltransferase [Zhongshania aliphaticivorans]
MDAEFWHSRWDAREIGFHQEQGNPLLKAHFSQLALSAGDRVFIPLCGKTKDIAWLLANNYRVVGAELSEIAVKELFAELGVTAQVKPVGKLLHYSASNIDIYLGDIFELNAEILQPIDAIYDRAALVALPFAMRCKYTQLLKDISHHAQQLVICFEYDQSVHDGPPFSVTEKELREHYEEHYSIAYVERITVAGGLKGQVKAEEVVYLLRPEVDRP